MVPETKINVLCKFSFHGCWNFISDFCFPPNDVLGTFSEISEVKDKGKPGPPTFVKMFSVIHPVYSAPRQDNFNPHMQSVLTLCPQR